MIPESPTLDTERLCSPRLYGPSHPRWPSDDAKYQDDKRFEVLERASHCSVLGQQEGPTGKPEYWCEMRIWLPSDAAHVRRTVFGV